MSQTNAADTGVWRLVHRTDAVVSTILICGAVVLWMTANTFEEVPALFSQNLQPDLFPKLLLACIIGLSAILPFEHLLLSGGRERLDGARTSPIKKRAYVVAAMIIVILAAMPYLGTIITIFTISLVMPLLWGERRLIRLLPFAALFPTAVIVLFGILLKVHLEPGIYGIGLY